MSADANRSAEYELESAAASPPVQPPGKRAPVRRAPSIAQMVADALGHLVAQNAGPSVGASGHAIKSYISTKYGPTITNADQLAARVNRHLNWAVDNGRVKRIRGRGASGSFRKVVLTKKPKKTVRTAKKGINSRNQMKGVREKVLKKVQKPPVTTWRLFFWRSYIVFGSLIELFRFVFLLHRNKIYLMFSWREKKEERN